MDLPAKPLVAVAVVVSALAVFFSTGLDPVGWCTWLAPIPILWFAPRVSGRVAFSATVLAWSAGGLNMARYLLHLLGVPPLWFVLFDLLPACVVGAAVLFYRAEMRKGRSWRASLGFAAILTAFEFLQSVTSIHGTFGSLAYTQIDYLPIIQVASITGIWGITFLLLWVPAAIAARRRAAMLTLAVILLVVFGYGYLRLHFTPPAQSTLAVGLASEDGPKDVFPDYAEMADRLGRQGAKLVVFPEKLAVVPDDRIAQIDALFEAAASAHQMEILVGVTHKTATSLLNEARLYSPDGRVEATYEKHHMLPPFESNMLVGTSRTVLDKQSGKWGITICKDMDFPLLSRQYGNDGVGLLLVPAWDFDADGWLHGRMAIMRGVESGFSIVRAAKQGILTVSDDRGRVLAQQVTASAPFASLLATVPVRHETTLYDRFGDWFGWLTVALAVWLIAGESLPRFARWSRSASHPGTPAENATASRLR